MMAVFFNFFNVSGANQSKSRIYVGVVSVTVKQLEQCTEFKFGGFPMKYLGVPLTPKTWSKAECMSMVDKISSRIHYRASVSSVLKSVKVLSYAGGRTSVSSVLKAMNNYRASIFLLLLP